MGNQASKTASKAATGASRRQYPSTSSLLNSAQSTPPAPSQAQTPAPSPAQPPPATGATVHTPPPSAPPSDTRSQHIDLDGRDPQFGSQLRALGAAKQTPFPRRPSPPQRPVQAFPTSSRPPEAQQAPKGMTIFPSSDPATNPALTVVRARERIARVWEEESERVGRKGFEGRTLLGAKDVREIVGARERGEGDEGLEERYLLRRGVLRENLERGFVGAAREG